MSPPDASQHPSPDGDTKPLPTAAPEVPRMRRTLATLIATTSLALAGAVGVAGPAAAAPSEKSVHTYSCPLSEHRGLHVGWQQSPSTERRNLGGTCINP